MSQFVAIAHADLPTAHQVVDDIGRAQAGHEIELDGRVIAERQGDGTIKPRQPSMAGCGAASGALWDGLIGRHEALPAARRLAG